MVPPNKGYLGTRASVLYSEVSFIRSVLYRRFHCIYKCYYIFVFMLVLVPSVLATTDTERQPLMDRSDSSDDGSIQESVSLFTSNVTTMPV